MKEKIDFVKKTLRRFARAAGNKISSECGDSNIIAVILITVVVIGLAVIFRKQMNEIVSKLFASVNTSIDSF